MDGETRVIGCLFGRGRLRHAIAERRTRLHRLAWSWCHDPVLAEDLAHDAIDRALASLAVLRDPARLDVWLTRILLNRYRDHRRRPAPETGLVDERECLVVLDGDGRGQAPATAAGDALRLVFHLTAPEQTVAGDLLDEVERLLVSYRAEGRPLRVEVVSHGDGLALLRDRLSAHKARIRALARRFDNLTFVACLNTIERMRTEHGIEVVLVPEAEVTRSGVSRVVRRQREGWAYIRV